MALPRLIAWLRRADVDVLREHDRLPDLALLAGRIAGCRVICHVHVNEPDMSIWKRQALLAPLHLCSQIIANSQSTRDWITSASSRLTLRTQVVYNGVEWPTSPDAVPLGNGNASKHLVVVGRLARRKGQDVAIEALRQLRARGYDVDLMLVGDVFRGYESFKAQLAMSVAERSLVD